MELSPRNERFLVEIAAGATTSVNFGVELLLGAAGRVTDHSGHAVAGVTITLHDAEGQLRGSVETNAFGFWRIDGLPPGRYSAQIEHNGQVLARRTVVLDEEFVFGQDFQIDAETAALLSSGQMP